jgi:hypothetical protein
MMQSLIQAFVPESWAKELDFSSLRKVNVKHVTDDLRTRENDLIWAIEFRGQLVYIICLIEFQSTIDHFMAVRVLTYTGLIYQDLLKQKKTNLLVRKKLPPIFPIVYYNGENIWSAPKALKDCQSMAIPEGLKKYQPNIEYMLLDVGRINLEAYTLLKGNLVLPLLALENASNPIELSEHYKKLIALVRGKEFDALRRDLLIYIKRVMKVQDRFPQIDFDKLSEGNEMLSERMDKWEQNWLQQGMQQGIQHERLSLLLKLIEKKLGTVSSVMCQQLENANEEELRILIDKILDEQPIEEIFI